MNRMVASILAVSILFQSFGYSLELISKISEVVEHATFHYQEYGDDLSVFLSKHYGELMSDHEKNHQEEKEQHENLPFKQLSSLTGHISLVLHTYSIDFPKPKIKDQKSHIFFYTTSFSCLYLDKQLRPPRIS